jgi:hypothetical protein
MESLVSININAAIGPYMQAMIKEPAPSLLFPEDNWIAVESIQCFSGTEGGKALQCTYDDGTEEGCV